MRLALALLLLALSGCQWALVRYHRGAEKAAVLECHREVEQPNALACYPYVEERLSRGGPVREL